MVLMPVLLLFKILTESDRYSPHNDMLSYWYDWGIVWLIVLSIMFIRIKRYLEVYKMNIGAIFLFLFVMSCWVT